MQHPMNWPMAMYTDQADIIINRAFLNFRRAGQNHIHSNGLLDVIAHDNPLNSNEEEETILPLSFLNSLCRNYPYRDASMHLRHLQPEYYSSQ